MMKQPIEDNTEPNNEEVVSAVYDTEAAEPGVVHTAAATTPPDTTETTTPHSGKPLCGPRNHCACILLTILISASCLLVVWLNGLAVIPNIPFSLELFIVFAIYGTAIFGVILACCIRGNSLARTSRLAGCIPCLMMVLIPYWVDSSKYPLRFKELKPIVDSISQDDGTIGVYNATQCQDLLREFQAIEYVFVKEQTTNAELLICQEEFLEQCEGERPRDLKWILQEDLAYARGIFILNTTTYFAPSSLYENCTYA